MAKNKYTIEEITAIKATEDAEILAQLRANKGEHKWVMRGMRRFLFANRCMDDIQHHVVLIGERNNIQFRHEFDGKVFFA
jgi:hypothetical protein